MQFYIFHKESALEQELLGKKTRGQVCSLTSVFFIF